MKFSKLHNPTPLRFRRFRRAGYAVFCSLACSVTIGCLAASVSDKSLQKAVSVSGRSIILSGEDNESPDRQGQLSELEAALLQAQELSLNEITFDSTAACAQQVYHFLIKTVERSQTLFNRFLFYSL